MMTCFHFWVKETCVHTCKNMCVFCVSNLCIYTQYTHTNKHTPYQNLTNNNPGYDTTQKEKIVAMGERNLMTIKVRLIKFIKKH